MALLVAGGLKLFRPHSEPEAARVGPFCGYKGARKRERASGVGGAVL